MGFRRNRARHALVGVVALTTAATTACSSDDRASAEDLPAAPALVDEAAGAARGIESAHVTLDVEGSLPGVPVRSIEGDLTGEGEAVGTGTLEQAGQLVEVEFVLTADTLYLKGPTGDYQEIPAAFASSVYDPSAILDPEGGIAGLLTDLRRPRTLAAEEISGTPAYKLGGTLPPKTLSGLLPGVDSGADVTFWVRRDDSRMPVRASAEFDGGATVDITLSGVNEPVTVEAPA